MTAKTAMDLVKDAKQDLETLSPQQVQEEMSAGNSTLVDLRETEERQQQGQIEGAVHAPRGLLEFYADPSTPYHKPELDKNKRLILHCASGNRSALAASTLRQMGFTNLAHLDGGMKAWKEAGLPVKNP